MAQQFVIISAARSGSNYLVSLLNSHPDICCYGEVFGKLNQRWLRPFDWRFLLPGLWLKLLQLKAGKVNWVGYKLMHEHFPSHMKRVLADPAVKIVWLDREDSLSRYVSLQKALQNKVWRSQSQSSDMRRLQIDTAHMLEKMRYVDREMKRLRSEVLEIPGKSLSITYEDMVERHPDLAEQQLCKFLQVPVQAMQPELKKQSSGDVWQQISNPDEVVAALTNSEYDHLIPPSTPIS